MGTGNPSEQKQLVSLPRRLGAEAVGTAFLLATVVGSGIMAEQLSAGNTAIALLANTIATGAALVALILTFGSISGAHFNPAVTIADAIEGGTAWRDTPYYVLAQVVGALAGTIAAHLMFRFPVLSLSQHARSGSSQLFSEFVAPFGLLSVMGMFEVAFECSRLRGRFLYHRCLLVHGVHLSDAPGFMVAQFGGAFAATFLFRWLVPGLKETAREVVVRHGEPRKDF